MSREFSIEGARRLLTDGTYEAVLSRRISIQTASVDPDKRTQLDLYLQSLTQDLDSMGFTSRIHPNPDPRGCPLLVASRVESSELRTVLCYGHGDVVVGMEGQWSNNGNPWELRRDGDRLYGRGTADNKGQHTLVLLALQQVLQARKGRLGFNITLLIETGEEIGSLGLREFCGANKEALAADLLIGCDGPRLSIDQPTVYLGTRGIFNFDLECNLRSGGLHSGNWGGLVANPAVLLANAIAALVEPGGRIAARGVLPKAVPDLVRTTLRNCRIDPGTDAPTIEQGWGEPGLSPEERLFGWNALEVLAMGSGNPERAVNAIPAKAIARCQIRFTADSNPEEFINAIRLRLVEAGIERVIVRAATNRGVFPATRLDLAHPLVSWVSDSIRKTLGVSPSIVPNAGGTLPNDCFALTLGLPTLWISHSYPGCKQHAPDEHVLLPLIDQGLAMMAGLFWDLGELEPATEQLN